MSDEIICYLCETNTTNREDYCSGCSQSICDECAVNDFNLPFGMVHDPEDHTENSDWGEDDDDC